MRGLIVGGTHGIGTGIVGQSHARVTIGGLVLAIVALTSCGSRTGLIGSEPCSLEGEVRACRDACGEGAQRCVAGYFEACVVPPVVGVCNNACGTGTRVCVDEEWSACEVPYAERACENQCGVGSQGCADGTWSECDVAPAIFACSNVCGAGQQPCESGALGGCETPIIMRDCASVCGSGHETCSGGAWQPCDAPQPRPPVLIARIRDFLESHPDFELEVTGDARDMGIVAFELGPDDKPVYQGNPTTLTTNGAENFRHWYNDTPGVNDPENLDLPLTPSAVTPGFFVYEDDEFFPIDERLFGNETRPHNYHFTLEARTSFEYRGGELFRFTGDDDMWVFVNRRLAIDLGGLHPPRPASVALDSIASTHGLIIGQVYPLHFFFAERKTVQSTFNIDTSIAEPGSCD